jgi:hypothetical protein
MGIHLCFIHRAVPPSVRAVDLPPGWLAIQIGPALEVGDFLVYRFVLAETPACL